MAKFLNLQGLQAAWARTKEYVAVALKSALTDRLGKANGIATLGADSKLTASQLPVLKSVNGQSIIGSGNIAFDISLYKIVQALPTTDIDYSKIYLVVDPSAPEGNVYKEYIYVNSKWELLGEYKADIDLTPYATKEFAESLVNHELGSYITKMPIPITGFRENGSHDSDGPGIYLRAPDDIFDWATFSFGENESGGRSYPYDCFSPEEQKEWEEHWEAVKAALSLPPELAITDIAEIDDADDSTMANDGLYYSIEDHKFYIVRDNGHICEEMLFASDIKALTTDEINAVLI